MASTSFSPRAQGRNDNAWKGLGGNSIILSASKRDFFHAYALSFFLLVISASWVANLGADWLQIMCTATVLAYAIFRTDLTGVNTKTFFAMLFLSSSVLAIPTIRSGAPQPTDILFFSSILIAAFSAEATRRNIDEALLAFVHLNYHLAVVSLLLFPLVFILPNLIVPVPDALQNFLDSEINGDRRFYTIFGLTYFATNSGVDGIWRNQSIFWEPGMLGFISVLSLALADAFGVGLRKRIVFVLTTLSTFAPGAYALLIIYFGLKLMRSGRKGVLRPLFTLVIFAVGAAATLPMLRELLLLLFGRDIYMDPSIYIRSTDFWLPYAVALKSPFFGFGSIEPYQIAMQIAIERRMDGITNSVGSYFYRYGYIWALGFLIWVITSFSRGSRPFVLIPIVMLLGVMYEPIGFSAVFLFLVFLARASR